MPVPIATAGMAFPEWSLAAQLYLQEVDDRLAELEAPRSPKAPYACLKADLPAAADYIDCVAYVTDTKILAASDGVLWRRQDTGAGI